MCKLSPEELLKRYRCLEKMRRKLVSYLVGRQELTLQEARDVADAAIEKAYEIIVRDQIMTLRNRSAWLWEVAYNEAMAMKREAAAHPMKIVDPDAFDRRVFNGGEDLEGRKELCEIIGQAIESLPQPHKDLMIYCYVGGFSVRQAAAQFNLRVAQVSGMLNTARRRMRAELLNNPSFRARAAHLPI